MRIIEKVSSLNNKEISLIATEEPKVENFKKVLLVGVVHGDEPQGEWLLEKFKEENENVVFENQLFIIPCLNPDGRDNKKRVNGNGVDLNRNFESSNWEKTEKDEFYSGDYAGSEIETRFLQRVIEKYQPDCILTIHAPYKVVNYDGDAKALAEIISEITKYPVQSDIGYPTPGSFGTYAGIDKKIPTITLELDEKSSEEELWNLTKPVFEYLAKKY